MRAASVALVVAVALLACRREGPPEVRRDEVRSAAAPPKPAPPPPPVHRVRGDIEGRFEIASATVVVGEPIVVTFEAKPTKAPLRVFVGGDGRNVASYPTRYAVRATDAAGKTVCDLVEKPAFPSFGGPGSERTLSVGEVLRERFVLNPACPALATPGKYRLALHRRITHLGMTITKPGATVPTSCDFAPIHEDSLPALDPACMKQLGAAPSVTSELPIVVAAFDDKALRAATDARLREASADDPKDEILRSRIERFVCGFLACGCKKGPLADGDIVAAVPSTLPKSYPGACP